MDPDNCGACGCSCPQDVRCIFGQCLCPQGKTYCLPESCNRVCDKNCNTDSSCVDLLSNSYHCGKCRNQCRTTCCNGICCASETECCNGKCVNLMSDNQNCGKCDIKCGEGKICKNGSCECLVYCDGVCVDVRSNKYHCGACGNSCGEGEICQSGKCYKTCDYSNNDNESRNSGCSYDCKDQSSSRKGFCVGGLCKCPTFRDKNIASNQTLCPLKNGHYVCCTDLCWPYEDIQFCKECAEECEQACEY